MLHYAAFITHWEEQRDPTPLSSMGRPLYTVAETRDIATEKFLPYAKEIGYEDNFIVAEIDSGKLTRKHKKI